MFINPQISRQLADEHRRDLIACDQQQQTLARQLRAGSGTDGPRQRLTNRLWHRLRSLTKVREWIAT
jgi:hypothetical protein